MWAQRCQNVRTLEKSPGAAARISTTRIINKSLSSSAPLLLLSDFIYRYLQLPARSLATGNTPAAAAAGDSTQPAAQHNPAGTAESADTTFKTLKAYLALKKLSLAGLQAKIRAQITAEAPGKQYCHVSLPGAPAGAVRNLAGWGSNLAGNSGNLAGFSGNLAGQLRCAESAESPMLILFRDVAKAQQQVRLHDNAVTLLHCC